MSFICDYLSFTLFRLTSGHDKEDTGSLTRHRVSDKTQGA